MPSSSPLFYQLILGVYALSMFFYLASLAIILRLLFCIFFRRAHRCLLINHKLSNFLKMNLICWTLMLGTSIPHMVFMSVHVTTLVAIPSRDPKLLPTAAIFWTQVFAQCFIPVLVFSIFFMILDRLFCIMTPISYDSSRKRIHLRIAIVCLAGVYLLIFECFLAELPLSECTDCIAFACVVKRTASKGFIWSKIVGGFLILCTGSLFIAQVRKHQNAISSALSVRQNAKTVTHHHADDIMTRANRVTIAALATELVLNFLPHIIVLTLYEITGIIAATYIGPHNLLLSSMEAFISALIFHWIFKKRLSVSTYQERYQKEGHKMQMAIVEIATTAKNGPNGNNEHYDAPKTARGPS